MSDALVPSPGVQKLDAKGRKGGKPWDHGYDHDGVKKIYVRTDLFGIRFITFDYVKGGQQKQGDVDPLQGRDKTHEFVIDHPEEYLVSMEAWLNDLDHITAIQFKTNQKSSAFIGGETPHIVNTTFQVPGMKIIGFYGSSGRSLDSIGAYFFPIDTTTPPPTPAGKIPAVGEDGGTSWDDGAFDGVRAVYVGQGDLGIGTVKFVYDKESQAVEGHEYGELTVMEYEGFVLDYPNEYITAVQGTFDKIYGSDPVVITMLRFTTNKRTSKPFGFEVDGKLDGVDKHFQLKEDGKKIVGFHGSAGEFLHKIGVHVLPITN